MSNEARSIVDSPDTAEKILCCDYCGENFDELSWGMLFWEAKSRFGTPPGDDFVTCVILAHKRCRGRRTTIHEYSLELTWLCDPMRGLRRLSVMAAGYRWTGAQLQRAIDIAWAVTMVASEEQAKQAADFYDRTGLL